MPIELYETAWAMLKEATVNRRLACHLANIATIGLDSRPKVRTVVLRDADMAAGTIRFHTDARSQKVAELSANPFIEAHFYDQPANIQIRLAGTAHIEDTSGPVARQAWADARSMSKVCYRLESGPGTPLEAGDGYGYLPYEKGEADPAEVNFRTVTIKVERVDVVVLKLDANRRAVFEVVGGEASGRWVVP